MVFKFYCLSLIQQINRKMEIKELNIANALFTAKEVLTQMIANRLADAKFLFALSNYISKQYNLTSDESIIVIEEALKIA